MKEWLVIRKTGDLKRSFATENLLKAIKIVGLGILLKLIFFFPDFHKLNNSNLAILSFLTKEQRVDL